MPWGAVAGAVASGVVGEVFADDPQTSSTSSAPWEPQQQYLTHGFEQAQGAFDTANGMGNAYTGQRVAGLNPYQTQGYNQTAGFAGQGLNAANQFLNAGQQTLGYGAQFGQNAASMFQQAGQDPTQQIIGNAGQYAANPYLDGQIDAASRDVMRQFQEQGLTGLDMAATGTGNMNSSRTGITQGIMARGVQDQIGDISAQMRGNAYNNGLNLASTNYQNGINNQMNVNGQLLSAGNFGRIATDAGLNAGYSSGDALTKAGAGFQTQDQNQLTAQQNAWNEQRSGGLDLVSKYMQAINGGYGGASTSTAAGAPAGQGFVTGALGGLGLFGKYSGGNGVQQGYLSGNSSDPFANSNADVFNSVGHSGTGGNDTLYG